MKRSNFMSIQARDKKSAVRTGSAGSVVSLAAVFSMTLAIRDGDHRHSR